MEDIKYVNFIESGLVIIKIHGVENGELGALLNNTTVHHSVFLAAAT